MEYVADLHVHSKYSRAVSQNMTLPVMDLYAKKKGINILATADWTHPLWFREITQDLEEVSEGLYEIKSQNAKVKSSIQNSKVEDKETLFILTTEISSIYTQGGKSRRIHNLVFAPSFSTAEKISKELASRGCNLMADGRPIIGLSSIELTELVLGIDSNSIIVPCHAWTPWFSLYGSNSGFDSIEECFGKYSKYIYAIETGLSSDPEMNWRIKELEKRSIISSSDSHSPAKMGREATVFTVRGDKGDLGDKGINYQDIVGAIKQDKSSKLKIRYTIEFYPEEGKYHYTGHRNCKVVQSPQETKEKGAICPVCHRSLTVGVMHRVEQLAAPQSQKSKVKSQNDKYGVRWYGDPAGIHPPYVKIVPLLEIIAESLDSTVASVKVKQMYDEVCEKLGSEFKVLLKIPLEEIEKAFGQKLSTAIKKVREGSIVVEPGFDGEFGKVKIYPFVAGAPQSKPSARAPQDKPAEVNEGLGITNLKDEEPQLALDF